MEGRQQLMQEQLIGVQVQGEGIQMSNIHFFILNIFNIVLNVINFGEGYVHIVGQSKQYLVCRI